MKALVVYESMYGNTHSIAEAIGDGLDRTSEVRVASISEIGPESAAEVDLLVVGGPTHIHGMSSSASRKAAAEAAAKDEDLDLEPGADGPGLRDWLQRLPDSEPGKKATAFDTRIDKPSILTGSAAKGFAKQLRRKRFDSLAESTSFFVEDSEGPLKYGEVSRARRWGRSLAKAYDESSLVA